MKTKRTQVLFKLLMTWLIISTFYYIPNLVSGELITTRDQNQLHKIFKYIIATAFTCLYIITYQDKKLILQIISYLAILAAFSVSIIFNTFHGAGHGFDAIIVFIAFIGIAHYASTLKPEKLVKIANALVIAAIPVSVFSYFEESLMHPILGDFWENTGGFRSVSTLLNPNNFGIYLGCILLFLIFGKFFNPGVRLALIALIIGAFAMSGSRTAWVSFLIAVTLGSIYRGRGKINLPSLLGLLVIPTIIISTGYILTYFELLNLPERATNPLTATIRLEKYYEYVTGFNSSYLYPDFQNIRTDLVSESGYFHLVNSTGIIFSTALIASSVIYLKPYWLKHLFSNHQGKCFDVAILYYLVTMAFENMLTSFPNNQLIFFVIGASVASWKSVTQQNTIQPRTT